MRYKLSEICDAIGVAFDMQESEIVGIHTLSEATSSQLSFFNSEKYLSQLPHTKAKAVLIEAKYAPMLPLSTYPLVTDEPYLKLALASKLFAPKLSTNSTNHNIGLDCDIDKSVVLGSNIKIGNGVVILGGCYIGDGVEIGDRSMIHPNVSILHGSKIGKDCIIHSGTVVGSDGFGFAHTKTGEHVKIYQNGNVVIEDDVEIGANCTIDRAVFGSTYIRKGAKLDNLIQIGHNSDIGEYSIMVSQSGVAGSTKLGRNVVMGGQSATAGHLYIGDFTTLAARTGVTKSLVGGKTYAGFPAMEHTLWLRLQAKLASLVKKQKS